MKRIVTILFSICLVLFGLFSTACEQKNPNKIRIAEVTRSIFYAPMYIAMDKGFFKDEGLDVSLTTTPGAQNVMAAIISKSADIGLMGPEATIYSPASLDTTIDTKIL